MEIDLKIWKHGSQRAPHKPLLLLYALGRWLNGQREFKWLRVKKDVGALIEQFGGNAKVEVSNPFTRLRKDLNGELWEIDGELVLGASDNPSVNSLNLINNTARFHPNFEEVINDHTVFNKIVTDLLTQHFADTQFEDILDACGISLYSGFVIKRSKRDPEFRQSVLDAYGHKCAICDYDIQFRTKIIGVEAAHIQWHNAQGPDIVSNGVALCAIHHKLLDYGAIGFNDDLELVAAHGLHGSSALLDDLIYDYVGHQISLPRNRMEEPSVEYVRWQRKEIFKGN